MSTPVDAVRTAHARQTLAALGAPADTLDVLTEYATATFDTSALADRQLPLPDAPQIAAWTDYATEAARDGVATMLRRRLVQCRFPIESGISATDRYRAATRRGEWPSGAEGTGLAFDDPDGLSLDLHPTLAGRIPVLTCRTRTDFVRLVQACSCRNEPEPVPASMGACLVTGLNNWDRVARARQQMEHDRGGPFTPSEWHDALRSLATHKEAYQDRLILLSREPYSAVPASATGLDEATWLERSVAIRREHEATHFVTLVTFGAMRTHLFDECLADFAGLAHAFGRYDAALALRVLGLEAYPAYRRGGRCENYLPAGVPPAAVAIVHRLLVEATRAIEAVASTVDVARESERHRMVTAIAGLSLVELAGDAGASRLQARLDTRPA